MKDKQNLEGRYCTLEDLNRLPDDIPGCFNAMLGSALAKLALPLRQGVAELLAVNAVCVRACVRACCLLSQGYSAFSRVVLISLLLLCH